MVPPTSPVTNFMQQCPSCGGARQNLIDQACVTCDGNGQVTTARLNILRAVVVTWFNHGKPRGSLAHICTETGFSQEMIDSIIDSVTPAELATGSGASQPLGTLQRGLAAAIESAIDEEFESEVAPDTRPEIESFSLHTLKGQAVLKLVILGRKHYPNGEHVSNRDFANDGLSLTNPPKMPPGPHSFRGQIRMAAIDLQPSGEIKQNLEIELKAHALITSGHYKGKGVLTSSKVVTTAGPPQPIIDRLVDERPIRRFKLD